MIGNPNETYYRYLARSRSACIARAGVHGRQERPTNGQVRPLCRSGRGTGIRGTAKALEGFGALALALVLVLLPRVAFASVASEQYGEPVYGPVTYDWQGETWTSVAYIAANKFDAAAYACGYSKSEVGQWDITVRAKLSNQSTARAFYELANGFFAPSPDDYVYTDYGPAPGFWGWAYSIYGEGNIWYHDGYTDTEVNDAKSEVEAILNGGGSGGGSGGQISGSTNVLQAYRWSSSSDGIYFGDTKYFVNNNPLTPAECVITFNASVTSFISEHSGYDVLVQIDGYAGFVHIWVVESGEYEITYRTFSYSGGTNDVPVGISFSSRYYYVKTNYVPSGGSVEGDIARYVMPAGDVRFVEYVPQGQALQNITYFTSTNPSYEPDPPENNWPDPDTPTVPDPPNPDAPTGGGNYVAPTLPKPTSPTQPVNVSVTVSTPVDDILEALNKIIQELENHCVHLQNKMVECSKYLGALEEQTRDAVIDAINEGMQNDVTLHDELMDYLRELLQWMKDNMKYDVEVTNTNNNDDVIDWLKRIYIQDGTGYSNTKPIDITQDYNGFGVWVDSLLGYVLPDLTDTNLAPVTSAFDALDDKFPFSVPGDVLRIFQSLDRSPVTPVVAVTIPSVLGIPAYTYSFDLSPYDTTMQTIRTIELMAFVVFLLVWARRAFNVEVGGASD